MNSLLRHACAPVLARQDGAVLLQLFAAALALAGMIAFALGVSGEFLPHDERYLGMTARELCALQGCRIVHFMIHDRISFGGALIALGVLYAWLTDAVRQGHAWAWRLLALSGMIGFASFFAYLGYGYLDTWHGLATLGLLPCFVFGLFRSRGLLQPKHEDAPPPPWRSACGVGRWCLLGCAAGMIFGGLTILIVGTTCVFVPQDLEFMGLEVAELQALNPRLVPLIAHDRAGFGGAVCCAGVAIFFSVRHGQPSRRLWWTLAAAGVAGFGAGIGAHPAVGYTDIVHLAPAVIGAAVYAAGLALTYRTMTSAEDCP
jgi:hypothetical protein